MCPSLKAGNHGCLRLICLAEGCDARGLRRMAGLRVSSLNQVSLQVGKCRTCGHSLYYQDRDLECFTLYIPYSFGRGYDRGTDILEATMVNMEYAASTGHGAYVSNKSLQAQFKVVRLKVGRSGWKRRALLFSK